MTDYDVDVLIAGAGPVGLMAALQLARWGVSVRVVDAAAGPATTSRALGTHSRSLEIYDQLGILGDVSPHGTRINAFIRHQADQVIRVDFDYGGLTTQFPYMFNVDQVITERVLRGHAAAAGAEVEWNVALESFRQDEQAVTVVLRHRDRAGHQASRHTGQNTAEGSEEIVRARYLWGCDGGHSTVRKALGLPLTGEAAHSWLIADAIVHTDVARDGVHWLFPAGGALMLFPFPEPGKWRLLDTSGDGDPDDAAQIARQFSTKLTQSLSRDTVVEDPSWVSRFTIQQRAVPSMHIGRCFVSGDAAHVHSPASGQGLNTGIQDAYNLAWKLTMVLRGDADAELLDSYDAERVPIGQALLASTGKVMDSAMVDTSGHDAQDTHETDRGFARQLIRNMSGLQIAYPTSALTLADDAAGPSSDNSAAPAAGPRPGERLTQVSAVDAQSPGWIELRTLLRAPAWHLLSFPENNAEQENGPTERLDGGLLSTGARPAWLHEVTIRRRSSRVNERGVSDVDGRVQESLHARTGDWILVRPDGYLSARGAGPSALRDTLDRLFGLLGPRAAGK